MSGLFTIALDAMGGDHGPGVVVPAAVGALGKYPDIELVLVGDESMLSAEIARHPVQPSERLRIHHASQVVGMDEPPAQALRNKKDSSMRVAINLVKDGKAHACVSAGNTGALMATARYVLKTLPGIDRPAISTAIPSIHGHTHMLDLGANVDCTAEHLFQFAVMGSVLVSAVDNNPSPKVGLLNIGQEEIKGSDQIKEAARLLEASNLNYIGFVEGDDIFCGDVDVVVCDGFVGNVSLKTSEGVARMVSHFIRAEFKRNLFSRFAALFAMPVLGNFKKRIDPRLYNGASLLGLQGIVIKSHGGADAFSFENAIRIARLEVEKNIAQRIDKQLEQLLTEREAS
ncbi:phosphate acyltransferase PlsX [Thioalkalivibrio sulfidiphilus]|uniref:Phosphate acyltransferase n=1 Tax=Thioalkalivibrio sulfidiphilus (strain HL-EbGR7) TaxID=396588 RepID=B8GSX8_THISH|nr:phosphate acyltransferase PlsX [Thioalkalivibrio sulfidiphilus]ACL72993.1 putative glycerol-3-phosphate acyltransferase PlsX [Thioalkalivibrio sulfidiphilus HL-EbGr7]